MAQRRQLNPLDFIPSPGILREKLTETEQLAERLRILLDVSERVHADPPGPVPAEVLPVGIRLDEAPKAGKGVGRG